MINGAHSDSAIRGSFSIDNGDSSQYITFKIRVRNWFFGSKNQDFFPKQQFLFRDSRLLKSVIDKDLKKSRNKCFFHDSKLGTKTKTNFKRLFQELKTLCFSAFIIFWRNVKYRWTSLELISWNGTWKEKFVLFISSITNEIRHFHVAVMQWLIKTVYLSKPIAFLTFSMPWSVFVAKAP